MIEVADQEVDEVQAVPASAYPFEQQSLRQLEQAKEELGKRWRKEHQEGPLEFYKDGSQTLMVHQGEPIGIIDLMGRRGKGVMNVFIKPEYRNRRLGLRLYQDILKRQGEILAVDAAFFQTPDSQRIWAALLRDPDLDVYAMDQFPRGTRHEVRAEGGKLVSDTINVWGNATLVAHERGVFTPQQPIDHGPILQRLEQAFGQTPKTAKMGDDDVSIFQTHDVQVIVNADGISMRLGKLSPEMTDRILDALGPLLKSRKGGRG